MASTMAGANAKSISACAGVRRDMPLTRDAVHDYYEIEKTPPGVRPADLRKTARVTYMDNVNVPQPDNNGETHT